MAKVKRLDPAVMGVHVGTLSGRSRDHVYLQHRDGVIVHGPTGSGKTWRLAYQLTCGAPGFTLATTTKADLLSATLCDRADKGRVAVFDPEDLTGWPASIRWSILAGCDDPDTAIRRAAALARAMPLEGTKNGGYFEGKASVLLRCYLFAAAVGGYSVRDLRVWVSSRSTRTAVDILEAELPDWAAELTQILDSGSDSSDDVVAAAARLLDPLASPKLLNAVDVPPAESFDVESFVLNGANTLYAVSKGTSKSMSPFVAALVAEAHYFADRQSQRLPGKRLDPPARFVLDEMNNVAPLPDLPTIMTDSGGRGITVWAFAHNQMQNEMRWGTTGGQVLSESAPAMLVLPGLRGERELASLSRLLGNRKAWQISHGAGGVSHQLHEEAILTPAQIRGLATDDGLLLYRNAPAMVVHLPTVWQDKRTKKAVQASMAEFDEIVASRKVPERYRPEGSSAQVCAVEFRDQAAMGW